MRPLAYVKKSWCHPVGLHWPLSVTWMWCEWNLNGRSINWECRVCCIIFKILVKVGDYFMPTVYQKNLRMVKKIYADDTEVVDEGVDYTGDAELIAQYVEAKLNGMSEAEFAEQFPVITERLTDPGFTELVSEVEHALINKDNDEADIEIPKFA